MSLEEPLHLAGVSNVEAPHVLAVLLRISVNAYEAAVRQRKDGNLKVSPLTMAFLEHGTFVTSHINDPCVAVRNISTGQRYSALMPAVLAEYLSGFQRGVRILEDHEFELILVSDDE